MAVLEIVVTVLAFIGNIGLIFNQIYLVGMHDAQDLILRVQLVSLADLSSDIMGPLDFCSNLEPLVIPEYIVHGVITILYLTARYFIGFLMNLPLAYYHLRLSVVLKSLRLLSRPHRYLEKRHQKRFDYTRMRRTEVIQREQRLSYLKLGSAFMLAVVMYQMRLVRRCSSPQFLYPLLHPQPLLVRHGPRASPRPATQDCRMSGGHVAFPLTSLLSSYTHKCGHYRTQACVFGLPQQQKAKRETKCQVVKKKKKSENRGVGEGKAGEGSSRRRT